MKTFAEKQTATQKANIPQHRSLKCPALEYTYRKRSDPLTRSYRLIPTPARKNPSNRQADATKAVIPPPFIFRLPSILIVLRD